MVQTAGPGPNCRKPDNKIVTIFPSQWRDEESWLGEAGGDAGKWTIFDARGKEVPKVQFTRSFKRK